MDKVKIIELKCMNCKYFEQATIGHRRIFRRSRTLPICIFRLQKCDMIPKKVLIKCDNFIFKGDEPSK